MTREISRKDLLRSLFSAFRDAGEQLAPAPAVQPRWLLRPPGAGLPDADYLAACTGCADCVPVCPKGAIFVSEAEPAADHPVAVILPERAPCALCTELPCIAACPEGALKPLPSPRQVRMGVAQVDPRACRTFRGEPCDLCLRFCPLPDEAIRFFNGRPVVVPAACTGCGMCAAVCPERPRAVMVVPERELIPGVRLPLDPPSAARRRG